MTSWLLSCSHARLRPVSGQPSLHVVVVELLAPEQPGERLPLHQPLVVRHLGRGERPVEVVRLGQAPREDRVERGTDRAGAALGGGQAEAHDARAAGGDGPAVARGRLRPRARGAHRVAAAVDHVVVERVLHARRLVRRAPEPARVGHVVGEEQLRRLAVRRLAREVVAPHRLVDREEPHRAVARVERGDRGLVAARPPRPAVAEPERRQQLQRRRVGAAVGHREPDQQVGRAPLRVLHDDVEVAVVVEDPGVEQLELRVVAPAPRALGEQPLVREGALRVLVERLHVRVRRHVVEVEPVVLRVLAVVPLVPREAVEALLEDRVGAVPERGGEAEQLVAVGDAEQPVLVPPVGAAPRVVVREVAPRVAVGAVVLAHGAPRALREVRAPQPPRRVLVAHLEEAEPLGVERPPGVAAPARERRDLEVSGRARRHLNPRLSGTPAPGRGARRGRSPGRRGTARPPAPSARA